MSQLRRDWQCLESAVKKQPPWETVLGGRSDLGGRIHKFDRAQHQLLAQTRDVTLAMLKVEGQLDSLMAKRRLYAVRVVQVPLSPASVRKLNEGLDKAGDELAGLVAEWKRSKVAVQRLVAELSNR